MKDLLAAVNAGLSAPLTKEENYIQHLEEQVETLSKELGKTTLEKNDLSNRYRKLTEAISVSIDVAGQLEQHRMLIEEARKLRLERTQLRDEVNRLRKAERHWHVLKDAINENPMLKEQWDEFCVLLRLTTD
jgi:regulator of replication initiation timing